MNNIVIDGSNLLWRTHWIAETRQKLVNSKGIWTGPIYMFLKSVKGLQEKFKPNSTYVTWDKKLKYPSTNFRKELAPETYKQNRDDDKSKQIHEQHDELSKWLTVLGVKQIYPGVLEADDIISWLVREKLTTSVIISVDKDLLQLIDDNIHYYNPIKKKLITPLNFVEEVGVEINEYNNYKALLGDKSDNVEGIQGYGVQKSAKLCKEGYEGIVQKLSEEDKQKFDKNLTLTNLYGSYLKEEGEAELYQEQHEKEQFIKADMKKFEEMCQEAEFYSFIKEMDKWKDSFSRGQSLVDLISQLS
jgi:5'-3' exonuclease